jgi:hypothetical protein
MELSRKPVQEWLGFPPVQADYLSLVNKVIPRMRGLVLLGKAGAGSSSGEVLGAGNSKMDS